MNPLQQWSALIERAAGLVLIAGVLTLAGVLVSKRWREQPMLPLAGLLVGPVFGLIGASLWGEAGAIAMTFVGTIAGPTLVTLGQDPAIVRRAVEHTLDRIAPKKKDGDE